MQSRALGRVQHKSEPEGGCGWQRVCSRFLGSLKGFDNEYRARHLPELDSPIQCWRYCVL